MLHYLNSYSSVVYFDMSELVYSTYVKIMVINSAYRHVEMIPFPLWKVTLIFFILLRKYCSPLSYILRSGISRGVTCDSFASSQTLIGTKFLLLSADFYLICPLVLSGMWSTLGERSTVSLLYIFLYWSS
jgi:hypothetical protein